MIQNLFCDDSKIHIIVIRPSYTSVIKYFCYFFVFFFKKKLKYFWPWLNIPVLVENICIERT